MAAFINEATVETMLDRETYVFTEPNLDSGLHHCVSGYEVARTTASLVHSFTCKVVAMDILPIPVCRHVIHTYLIEGYV